MLDLCAHLYRTCSTQDEILPVYKHTVTHRSRPLPISLLFLSTIYEYYFHSKKRKSPPSPFFLPVHISIPMRCCFINRYLNCVLEHGMFLRVPVPILSGPPAAPFLSFLIFSLTFLVVILISVSIYPRCCCCGSGTLSTSSLVNTLLKNSLNMSAISFSSCTTLPSLSFSGPMDGLHLVPFLT